MLQRSCKYVTNMFHVSNLLFSGRNAVQICFVGNKILNLTCLNMKTSKNSCATVVQPLCNIFKKISLDFCWLFQAKLNFSVLNPLFPILNIPQYFRVLKTSSRKTILFVGKARLLRYLARFRPAMLFIGVPRALIAFKALPRENEQKRWVLLLRIKRRRRGPSFESVIIVIALWQHQPAQKAASSHVRRLAWQSRRRVFKVIIQKWVPHHPQRCWVGWNWFCFCGWRCFLKFFLENKCFRIRDSLDIKKIILIKV